MDETQEMTGSKKDTSRRRCPKPVKLNDLFSR